MPSDLDGGSVAVTHTVVEGSGGPELRRETKTTSSRRRLSLDEATLARLREHRRRQLTERLAWEGAYVDLDLVFCREDGSVLRPAWVSRRFERLRVESGARRIRFHDLRHTWATLALTSGVPLRVVMERLGHSSITITANVYSHVVEGLDRQAADLVAAAVAASSTQSSTQSVATDRDRPRRRS
jgi:integrase